MVGWGTYFKVSGIGNREPGTGEQVQVRDQGPVPAPEDLNQKPEGRDLGPEKSFCLALSLALALG